MGPNATHRAVGRTPLTHRSTVAPLDFPAPKEQHVLELMAQICPPGQNVLFDRPSSSTLAAFANCTERGWVEEVYRTEGGLHVYRLTQTGCALAVMQ